MALQPRNIGRVPTPRQQTPFTQVNATPEDFGAGVGRALQGLGVAVGDWATFNAMRERQNQENTAALDWTRREGEINRRLTQMQQEAPEDAAGFTNEVETFLRTQKEEFFAANNITDPQLRATWDQRLEGMIQGGLTQSLNFEIGRTNQAFQRNIGERLSASQARLYENPDLFDSELTELTNSIRSSTLPAPEQEALIEQVSAGLVSATYQRQLEVALNSNLPVAEPGPGNVVAPGMTPLQVGLLQTLSGVESGGDYNVIYGGGTFTDFSDHPRRRVRIPEGQPNAGKTSSAAGKYQFLADTWDDVVEHAARRGVIIPDFSPVSQDIGAWEYAMMVWEDRGTGGSLEDALANNPSAVKDALQGDSQANAIWQGLWSLSDEEFASRIGLGYQIGGTEGEYNPIPDPLRDPRFEELPFEVRMQLHQQAQSAVDQARTQRVQQDREIEVNAHASLVTRLQNGDASAFGDVQAALANGAIRDIGLRDDLIRRTAEQREAQANVANITARANAGETFVASDDDDLMDYYEANGVAGLVRSGDASGFDRMVQDAQTHNYVPRPLMDAMFAQLGSSNATVAANAAAALAQIADTSPMAQYATEDQYARAAAISTMIATSRTPAEALQRDRYMSDPKFAAERKAMTELAEEQLEGANIDSMITNGLDSITSWEPQMPRDFGDSIRLRQQFVDSYKEGFVMFGGDAAAAQSWAAKRISYNWGQDPINEGRLMEFSPLAAGSPVRPLNGSYDWIAPAVRQQLGLSEDAQFTLHADKETWDAFVRGETPTYRAVVRVNDQDGYEIIDIAPSRVTIAPTEEQVRGAELERTIAETEAQIANLKAQIAREGVIGGRGQTVPTPTPDQQRLLDLLNRRLMYYTSDEGQAEFTEPLAPSTEPPPVRNAIPQQQPGVESWNAM